jgi:hypothetical protein
VVAAVVVVAALAAPSAAFACGGGVSAVSVYKECLPSGGGGGKAQSGGGGGSPGVHTRGTTSSLPVSNHTKRALKKAGKDGKSLSNLVKRFGAARLLQSHAAGDNTPTAVGSAFDLGSGPTALLIVLAGSAVLLLATTGFRSARQRRP